MFLRRSISAALTCALLGLLSHSALHAATSTQPAATQPAPPPIVPLAAMVIPIVHHAEAIVRSPISVNSADDQKNALYAQRNKDVHTAFAALNGKKTSATFIVDGVSGDSPKYVVVGHLAWISDTQLSQADKNKIVEINNTAEAKVKDLQKRYGELSTRPINHYTAQQYQNVYGGSDREMAKIQQEIKNTQAKQHADVADVRTAAERMRPPQLITITTSDATVTQWSNGQTHALIGVVSGVDVKYYSAVSTNYRTGDKRYWIYSSKPTEIAMENAVNAADIYVGSETSVSSIDSTPSANPAPAATSAPASDAVAQVTVDDLVQKINAMPKTFWYTPTELAARKTLREDWIKNNIKPNSGTFSFTGTVKMANITASSRHNLAMPVDSESAVDVQLDCGKIIVWDNSVSLFVSATILDVPPEVLAGWDTSKTLTIIGSLHDIPQINSNYVYIHLNVAKLK